MSSLLNETNEVQNKKKKLARKLRVIKHGQGCVRILKKNIFRLSNWMIEVQKKYSAVFYSSFSKLPQ